MACENGNDIRRSERESRPGSQDQSVWQEKIVELRRSRAGIAGSLTVKEEELLKVLQEKEASDEIKVKSESLSRTLSEFERCCRYLCLYLETHKLYDELTEAQSYNETIITRVQQVLKTARERTALDTEARVIHKGTDRECGDSLHPEDSVSRSGRHSHVSTTSSARARASAKRAALQAKAKVMEEVMKKRMEVEHLKLRKTEEELGLQQLELEPENSSCKVQIYTPQASLPTFLHNFSVLPLVSPYTEAEAFLVLSIRSYDSRGEGVAAY
ncbi:hypothetical protein Pmani_030871 [Petrolisthes manimaculis]|uniref:Uncharacterized protein n=1 Tax=Petrolisthes manimaculis TaxID=1843537 RepID=A0AAE1NUR8_9EUCA|nr:hypothetical protein Pmani_030871 [Petrolisthes manimaculis]